MKYNSDSHPKKSLRLKEYDYSRLGAYFITICTYEKECIFGKVENERMLLNQFGQIVLEFWNKLAGRYATIELDSFVIMPNHVHGIIKIIDTVGAIHELPLQTANPTFAIRAEKRLFSGIDCRETLDFQGGGF